jgi:hypothetical protein
MCEFGKLQMALPDRVTGPFLQVKFAEDRLSSATKRTEGVSDSEEAGNGISHQAAIRARYCQSLEAGKNEQSEWHRK